MKELLSITTLFVALMLLNSGATTSQSAQADSEIKLVANSQDGTVALLDVVSRSVLGIDVNPARTKSTGPFTGKAPEERDLAARNVEMPRHRRDIPRETVERPPVRRDISVLSVRFGVPWSLAHPLPRRRRRRATARGRCSPSALASSCLARNFRLGIHRHATDRARSLSKQCPRRPTDHLREARRDNSSRSSMHRPALFKALRGAFAEVAWSCRRPNPTRMLRIRARNLFTWASRKRGAPDAELIARHLGAPNVCLPTSAQPAGEDFSIALSLGS